MTAKQALLIGAIGGAASSLMSSPAAIAKFKFWKDPDPLVRKVFWASAILLVVLVILAITWRNKL